MIVINEYLNSNGGHHYKETFFESSYFCPSCGQKKLWMCVSGSDYYIGSEYVCTNCSKKCYLDKAGDFAKESILRQLQTGVTDKPTTKKGC